MTGRTSRAAIHQECRRTPELLPDTTVFEQGTNLLHERTVHSLAYTVLLWRVGNGVLDFDPHLLAELSKLSQRNSEMRFPNFALTNASYFSNLSITLSFEFIRTTTVNRLKSSTKVTKYLAPSIPFGVTGLQTSESVGTTNCPKRASSACPRALRTVYAFVYRRDMVHKRVHHRISSA